MGPGNEFFAKTRLELWGSLGDLKNGPFWLKFGTLLPWVNILGIIFHFSKNVKFGAWDEFFTTATNGPPNSWKNTEVEPSALRTFDYFPFSIF